MNVVLASNYLNVHQRPFCEEMLALLGDEGFKFIATTPFNQLRLTSGYEDMNQAPFVIRAYESPDEAAEVFSEADIAIGIPYSSPDLIRSRLASGEKLTFAYSERLLKRGLWFRHVPQKRKRIDDAFLGYRDNRSFHVLCASAFTSYDLSLFGFPPDRCWRWGYFPRTTETPTPKNMTGEGVVSLVWVGRFIEWKRPFMPLRLARWLKRQGYSFHLSMIGDGELRASLEDYVRRNNLEEQVTLVGAVPNETVQRIMARSDIFLFTSDRTEGWGAALSEAMGNGCVPVASSLIGSVPYLIDDGVNGRVFPDGDEGALRSIVAQLLEDREVLERLASKAPETIALHWNPACAAQRLIEFSRGMLNGTAPRFEDGPCAPAGIIEDRWFTRTSA